MEALHELYATILSRKETGEEGSYTRYLFTQGLDKILKKCAEECGEVIIAAKNGENEATVLEISDLLYHLSVLMAQQDITWEQVEAELEKRSEKQGNLKQFHQVDKNT